MRCEAAIGTRGRPGGHGKECFVKNSASPSLIRRKIAHLGPRSARARACSGACSSRTHGERCALSYTVAILHAAETPLRGTRRAILRRISEGDAETVKKHSFPCPPERPRVPIAASERIEFYVFQCPTHDGGGACTEAKARRRNADTLCVIERSQRRRTAQL